MLSKGEKTLAVFFLSSADTDPAGRPKLARSRVKPLRSEFPRRRRFVSATRAYHNSFKSVADCIPKPNLCRLLVGLNV
jgi:hypothetical protein